MVGSGSSRDVLSRTDAPSMPVKTTTSNHSSNGALRVASSANVKFDISVSTAIPHSADKVKNRLKIAHVPPRSFAKRVTMELAVLNGCPPGMAKPLGLHTATNGPASPTTYNFPPRSLPNAQRFGSASARNFACTSAGTSTGAIASSIAPIPIAGVPCPMVGCLCLFKAIGFETARPGTKERGVELPWLNAACKLKAKRSNASAFTSAMIFFFNREVDCTKPSSFKGAGVSANELLSDCPRWFCTDHPWRKWARQDSAKRICCMLDNVSADS
mmetsp:Transcript_126886/g.237179  ORF Transcript_126886/g.237179 Transcript_126886/m.237179 type:complete len:272 (-) Transcript_126886:38-853(-)